MPQRHKDTNLPAAKAEFHKENRKCLLFDVVLLGDLVYWWQEIQSIH